jgi:hypothetical protein
MSRVSRRLISKHTGPAVKRNVRHCLGQKPHRRSRSGCVTSAGLESLRHEVLRPRTPRRTWLRGLDFNQRPLMG